MGLRLAQQSVVPKKPKGTRERTGESNQNVHSVRKTARSGLWSGTHRTGGQGFPDLEVVSSVANLAALLCSLESSPLSCISLAPVSWRLGGEGGPFS